MIPIIIVLTNSCPQIPMGSRPRLAHPTGRRYVITHILPRCPGALRDSDGGDNNDLLCAETKEKGREEERCCHGGDGACEEHQDSQLIKS